MCKILNPKELPRCNVWKLKAIIVKQIPRIQTLNVLKGPHCSWGPYLMGTTWSRNRKKETEGKCVLIPIDNVTALFRNCITIACFPQYNATPCLRIDPSVKRQGLFNKKVLVWKTLHLFCITPRFSQITHMKRKVKYHYSPRGKLSESLCLKKTLSERTASQSVNSIRFPNARQPFNSKCWSEFDPKGLKVRTPELHFLKFRGCEKAWLKRT